MHGIGAIRKGSAASFNPTDQQYFESHLVKDTACFVNALISDQVIDNGNDCSLQIYQRLPDENNNSRVYRIGLSLKQWIY